MSKQSVQSVVLDAAVSKLQGTDGRGNAYRTRFTAFDVSELPAENVVPDDEAAEYQTSDDIDLRFRFKVRHLVAKADAADKLADLRYVRGQKLLFADTTLGGLVRVIRYIGRKWEFEEANYEIVALVVTYEVEFSQSRNDPSVPGL